MSPVTGGNGGRRAPFPSAALVTKGSLLLSRVRAVAAFALDGKAVLSNFPDFLDFPAPTSTTH